MGQKTNPTSLRLNKTNRNFDSLWYNSLHYSRLIGDEIATKSHIEQVFAQATLPRNLWSFSPIFKRGRGLVVYLSPDRCRATKSTKLRLRRSVPLLQRDVKEINTSKETRLTQNYMVGNDISFTAANTPYLGKEKPGLAVREKRQFVHCLLTSLVCNTSSRSKALLHGDSSLLQKAHTLSWLHGDGYALKSSTSWLGSLCLPACASQCDASDDKVLPM